MNGADGHFDLIKFKRDLYFKGGQKLMTEGDFASAQIYFMKILQIIFDIQAQFQLARCQQMLQEFQTALQTYEEVFQKNMKDPRPVYQQAYIYDVNLKQSELALTHYEKAANILTSTLAAAATASQFKEDPKYSIIFYTLGCKYEQRRQEDKAKRAFQQFLDFPAPISEKDRIRVNKKLIALSSRFLEDSETFNYKKSKQNQEANSQAQSQSKQLMQGSQLSPKHIQSIPRQQSFIKQGNNNEDEKSRSLQLRMQSQPSQLQQNQYENLGNSQPYLDVKDEISQKKEVRKPGDSNISSQQSTAEVKIPSIRPSNLFNAGQLEEQSLNSRAQHVQQQDFRFISAQNQQHLPPNLNQQHQQSQQYQQQQHQQQSQINQSQQQQYQQQQQQSSPQIILNGSEIKYNNNQSLINQQSQQQLSQQQIQQQQQQLPQGGYRSSESTIKYNQNSNQNISAQQIQQNTLQRHQNSTIKLNEFNSQEQMDAYFKRITFDANGPGSMWNSPFSHDDHNIDLIDKYEEVKHHFYPPYEEDYEEIFDDDIPDEKDGKMMQNKTSFNNTHTIKNIPMKSFIELTSSKQQNPSAISGVSHLSLSRFSYINYDQGSMISNNRQQQKDFEHPEKSMSAYMLDKQLGEGSYGKVYEVIYKADGNSFALKLIPNKEIHRQQLTNGEIDVMKILNHKNIIKIYNAFKSDDQQSYCIISELADNGTLKDYIKKKKGNVDKYEVLNLMKQMITALNYIHSQRIIHRDIKPSNIFLHGNSKQIKIGDFGIAKKLQNREIQQDVHSVGTEKYFSPEYRNEGFSEKSDIWSMGIVFLELLGVQVNGELNEQMKREHLKQIPPEMSEIIAGMTQTDPTMRSNSTKVINQLKVIK